MFCINECSDATCLLALCDGMDGQCGLTRRLRTIDLDDPAFGITTYTQGGIQCDTAGGDNLYIFYLLFTHTHDGAFTEILLDLSHCSLQGLQLLLLRSQLLRRFFFLCHSF